MAKSAALPPAWTWNLGALRASGAQVVARCSRCEQRDDVDLDRLIAARGELYSLWNRHPPCRRRCGDRVFFAAIRPDARVWPTVMTTERVAETAQLHRPYEAEQAAIRREDTLWRWLRKHQLHRSSIRREARKRIDAIGGAAADEAASILFRGVYREEQLAEEVEVYREVRRRLGLPDRARRG